jgi:hypothetical protein
VKSLGFVGIVLMLLADPTSVPTAVDKASRVADLGCFTSTVEMLESFRKQRTELYTYYQQPSEWQEGDPDPNVATWRPMDPKSKVAFSLKFRGTRCPGSRTMRKFSVIEYYPISLAKQR